MPDSEITPGYIQETFLRLRRIQRASQKENMPNGGVTITYNMTDGITTGTFIFPIVQEDVGDNVIIKAVDFAE